MPQRINPITVHQLTRPIQPSVNVGGNGSQSEAFADFWQEVLGNFAVSMLMANENMGEYALSRDELIESLDVASDAVLDPMFEAAARDYPNMREYLPRTATMARDALRRAEKAIEEHRSRFQPALRSVRDYFNSAPAVEAAE